MRLLCDLLTIQQLSRYLQGNTASESRRFDPLPIISALNLLLSAHPARPGGGILVGRNRYFFKSAMEPFSLGGSLEAWRGFYSSVRPAHYQLMINVNGMRTPLLKVSPADLLSLYNGFLRSWKPGKSDPGIRPVHFWRQPTSVHRGSKGQDYSPRIQKVHPGHIQ